MSINLEKGQNLFLKDSDHDLSKLTIGLGWDTNKSGGSQFDLDASAILLESSGKPSNKMDLIYFGEKMHFSKKIWSNGDNLTGAGEGDDEQITVKLNEIAPNYEKIIFFVNIYQATSRRQHFGLVENAFIRAVDAKGVEIAKFQLSGKDYSGKTAMMFAELYRNSGGWKFKALGDARMADSPKPIYESFK